MYKKAWTQFETQSLAFGLLRKALYPTYLVRGDLGTITIYRPTVDITQPKELMTIHVMASDSKEQSGFHEKEPGKYVLIGGDQAYNILKLVFPLLVE